MGSAVVLVRSQACFCFVYSCMFALSCARMFGLRYSRLSSLDPVLQLHPRRGFLAFTGRHTHIHDGNLPQNKCVVRRLARVMAVLFSAGGEGGGILVAAD